MGHGHHCNSHHDHCHTSHGNGGCCCSSSCCSHHDSCEDESHECDWGAAFLELADEAWMEVLKEKIKEHIRTNDKKINELATIVAEANCEKWKKKMANQHCCDNYEQKLHECLNSCCSESNCKTK